MNKNEIVNFIKKYYLGGAVDQCTMWDVSKKTLYTKFMSKDKNLLGNIKLKSFDCPDISFAIFDAAAMLKLLNLLGNDIDIEFGKVGDNIKKLKLSDKDCSVEYALAEPTLVPDTKGTLKRQPDIHFNITMNQDFVTKYIKAKSAIGNDPDNDNFAIVPKDNKTAELILGYSNNVNTNQVKLPIDINIISKFDSPILFSASLLKSVLDNNSDAESLILNVSLDGLGIVNVDNELYTANYYFVSTGNGNAK